MGKKNKTCKLKSKRLILQTASLEEMEQLRDETDDGELKKAYQEMLDGCVEHPEQYAWYAAWKIIERQSGNVIGDCCFKGAPSEGAVEIGYGITQDYEGKGYTTEAVKTLCEWALAHEKVYFILAETEADNVKSQRVLEKNDFQPMGKEGEEGPLFFQEKGKSNWLAVYMCLGLSVGMSIGLSQGNQALGMCLGMCLGICLGSVLDNSDKKNREMCREKLLLNSKITIK